MDIDRINRAATFAPQDETYTRPCLTIGGVQVYAYFNQGGELVVAVHYEDADPAVIQPRGEDGVVPTVLFLGVDTEPVWSSEVTRTKAGGR